MSSQIRSGRHVEERAPTPREGQGQLLPGAVRGDARSGGVVDPTRGRGRFVETTRVPHGKRLQPQLAAARPLPSQNDFRLERTRGHPPLTQSGMVDWP